MGRNRTERAATWWTSVSVLLLLLSPFLWRGKVQAQPVDFRYAPSPWRTLISFPADGQKTLVNEEGELAYDFGPGPYARPGTQVRIGVAGDTLRRVHQHLSDPRVPIVVTEHEADGGPIVHLRVLKAAGFVAPDGSALPDRWGAAWGESFALSSGWTSRDRRRDA